MANTTFHSITLPGMPTAKAPEVSAEFNIGTNYVVGDYCTYQGSLYRCITAHSAGAWNAAHFIETNIDNELDRKLIIPISSPSAPSNPRVGDLWIDNDEDSAIYNVDAYPIAGSTNAVSSGGVYQAIQNSSSGEAPSITIDAIFSATSTNAVQNKVITERLNTMDDAIKAASQSGGSGMTEDVKQALLQLAQKVAYIDAGGTNYYQDLYDALYPSAVLTSITAAYTQSGTVYTTDTLDSLKPDLTVTAHYDDSTSETVTNYTLSGNLTVGTSVITVSYGGKTDTFDVTVTRVSGTFSISNNLTGCTNSNSAVTVAENAAYNATIIANTGYTLTGATVSITIGGSSVTGYYSNGTISIPNVTGDVVITVVATAVTLSSISAVFNQGSATIYDTDSLDTLKQYLTVTATYSDSSTATVPSADYTLSGTLTEGTSTITVSYQGKNTTFNATVTAAPRWSVTYNLTNFSSSNQATSVVSGSTYVTTLSYDDTQYMFGSVTVTMGGTDITTTAYGDGRVQINEVTGNIVITAIANEIVYNTVLNRQTGSGLQFFDNNGTQIGGKAYQWYGYVPQTASANCTATIKIVNNGESTIGANEKIYAGNTDQFDQTMWVKVYTDCALAYTVSSLGIAPGGSITFTATVKRGYRLVFTSFSGCDVYVTGIPTDAIVYATEYATVIFGAADVTQWYPDDGSGTATTKYYGSNRITTDAFTEDTTVTVIYENGSAASGDVNANDRLFGCCQSAANRQTPIYYFVAPSAAGNAGIPEYGYARYVYEVKAGYHLAIKSNAESALAAGYSVRVVKGNVR